jgi:alpha-glucuronidase
LPRIAVSLFADNIKELYKDGIDLYYTQAGNGFAINGINYYVAGKLLWNTALDKEKILNDYYQKGFGCSGIYIKNFYTKLEEAWKSATKGGIDVSAGTLKDTRVLELYTPELLNACTQDLEMAAKAAENEIFRKRVAFIRDGFQYTLLTVEAVRKSKRILALNIPLFSKQVSIKEIDISAENGKQQTGKMNESKHKAIEDALKAWEQRDTYVEDHKSDYVLSYYWVKYNDMHRYFNPHQQLKTLLKTMR